jgi:hypothetical protein
LSTKPGHIIINHHGRQTFMQTADISLEIGTMRDANEAMDFVSFVCGGK